MITNSSTPLPSPPSRVVHTSDAIAWLQQQPVLQGCSIVTSLPDISECRTSSSSSDEQLPLAEYKAWLVSTAQLVLGRCPDDGVCIFFQTDIKVDGVWVDKAYLIQRAAEELAAAEESAAAEKSAAAEETAAAESAGEELAAAQSAKELAAAQAAAADRQHAPHVLLWHKIVCRTPAGEPTFTRPAYHHMLCFSRRVRIPTAASTADVLPAPGDTTWARGMGTAACAAAVRFVRDHCAAARTIVDPFCGHGTVLAVANQMGLDAVGVEISPKRAKQAQRLCMAELSRRAAARRGNGRRQQPQLPQQQPQRQSQAQDAQGEEAGLSGGSSRGSGGSSGCVEDETSTPEESHSTAQHSTAQHSTKAPAAQQQLRETTS